MADTQEQLLPTKATLSPTDTVRVMDNADPMNPVSSQTPVSTIISMINANATLAALIFG